MELSEFNDDGELETRTEIVDRTIGRALLSSIVPKGLPLAVVNKVLNKRAISKLSDRCDRVVGLKDTVIFADQLRYADVSHSTRGGISISMDDMVVPEEKQTIPKIRKLVFRDEDR
jgi:DNA-directed RNA polymerase subunit beta' (EC 2.7.7.6)